VKFDDIAWLPVEIYRSTQSICLSSYSAGPTFEKLKTFLRGLGLPVSASTKKIEEIHDEALPFDFPMSTKSRIPCSSEEFQLRFCGPYMEKALDAKPDDRVQFVPDGWQRKVLDILDKNESVAAVAPTSTGKTFIAYYAIERILKGDDDGVLVYIAPTKALVNQIGAEVYARFAKKHPSAGSSIWAIHTRDYRINNPYGCQILVTVPEVFTLIPLRFRLFKANVPKDVADPVTVTSSFESVGTPFEENYLRRSAQYRQPGRRSCLGTITFDDYSSLHRALRHSGKCT
jgi:hypothetical protein